jgi:hypothetical protein
MSRKKHPPGIRWDFRFMERTAVSAGAPVPVFYNEQDQNGQPCTVATRDELKVLKRKGEGKFINRGKAFRLNRRGPTPPPQRYSPSLSTPSDASISVGEIRANVGEPADTPGAEIARHVVKRAQEKIRAIGAREEGTFDQKAVLAFGRSQMFRAVSPG